MAQPGPVTMASVRPALPSQTMSSTIGACHVWGGGGIALSTSVEITCISKQHQVLGWSGVGFLARDWDGALPNASGSSRPFQLLCGVRMWLSVWILIPGFWSSRLLNLAAIDTKTVAMNWNSRYVHSVWAQRPMQENKEITGLVVTALNSWWVGGPFIHHKQALSHTWKMLPTWEGVSNCLINHQISNLRDGHELLQLWAAKPDLWDCLLWAQPGMPQMSWAADYIWLTHQSCMPIP